jgi:hypothetical protein
LSGTAGDRPTDQLGLFAAPGTDERSGGADEVITRRLKDVDVDDITPRQALELLAELKALAEE